MSTKPFPIHFSQRGHEAYQVTFDAMRQYTDRRNENIEDQLWIVEHDPVYTLGLAADRSHVLNANNIPVIETDRGGEVTYHGPGQAVVYVLLDLKRQRRQGMIKEFVSRIEQAVIDTLTYYKLLGERKPGAPGIYINRNNATFPGAKIASLGLKVRASGCTYHGVALNVDMDLAPFLNINPCGYENLACVDMKSMGVHVTLKEVQDRLANCLKEQLE